MTNYFQHTTRGLIVTGNPTFEDWQAEYRGVKSTAKDSFRRIGDLQVYGELTYGDLVEQENDESDCDNVVFHSGTIYNAKYVSSHWWPVERRIYDLPWSFYQETAPLKPHQQEALMQQAESEGWNRDKVRRAAASYQQMNGKRQHKPIRPDDIIFDQQQQIQQLQEQVDQLQQSHAALDSQPPAESPLLPLPDGTELTEWEQDQIKSIGDVAKNNGWLSVTIYEDGSYLVTPKKDGE